MFTRDRELNGVPIGSSALTKKSVECCVSCIRVAFLIESRNERVQ